ncbi:MAG: hypothetical protein NTW19_00655 [Planctomycetota bacterium]|nr:hypothetical protein [Planctomycetota bacterium]
MTQTQTQHVVNGIYPGYGGKTHCRCDVTIRLNDMQEATVYRSYKADQTGGDGKWHRVPIVIAKGPGIVQLKEMQIAIGDRGLFIGQDIKLPQLIADDILAEINVKTDGKPVRKSKA